MAATQQLECWDDDLDLEGPILSNSVSTYQTSQSSRLSIRSESNAGDDDWNVSLAPNDEKSTAHAIYSAKLAGIPIPANVPSSALLGGTIKKLGSKTSLRPKKDDWNDDLEFSNDNGGPLTLKKKEPAPATLDDDDFDWTDGSLGIRHGGIRHASSTMSPHFGLRSPSIGSVKTAESEEDGTGGLLLPTGPLDFQAALKKRQEAAPVDRSPALTSDSFGSRPTTARLDREDSFDDIDFGPGDVFDPKKRTLNRNLKHQFRVPERPAPLQKVQASLTFSDKSAGTRIPRPVPSTTKPSRLEPVFESGPSNITRSRFHEPTPEPRAPMLRQKRSMPALRSQPPPSRAPAVPALPSSLNPAYNRTAQARVPPYTAHVPMQHRRESDPSRAQSPTMRAHSRLSHAFTPDTPTRQRRDLAPAALAREAASKRQVTKPARRRNFGDGTELDTFDDLPTSAAKESIFMKQPTLRGQPNQLRSRASQQRLGGIRDKMTTPLPPPSMPRSPAKIEQLPRFARDTAASRIAREQTIGGNKPNFQGPLMNRTNQSSMNLLRTPQTNPSAKRTIRRGPTLVAPMGKENVRHWEDDAAKKGMKWNPVMYRWEGNEKAIQGFDPVPPPSPPRPALITNFGQPTSGALISGNMVFDNQAKRWLKLGTAMSDPRSPVSVGDDDDPFRDIEDLKEEKPSTAGGRGAGTGMSGDWLVGEEFDVGPAFVQRQREEEATWREKTMAWFAMDREREGESYKWAIRDIAANALV